jgi:hypothetical protein
MSNFTFCILLQYHFLGPIVDIFVRVFNIRSYPLLLVLPLLPLPVKSCAGFE